MHNGVLTNPKR
jgi:hypothetical protein